MSEQLRLGQLVNSPLRSLLTYTGRLVNFLGRMAHVEQLYQQLASEVQLARVRQHGSRCFVGHGSQVRNGEYMQFGDLVRIGPYSRLEAVASHMGHQYAPALILEDGVTTEWFTHIACAGSLRIGHDTLVAAGVYITDHDHGYSAASTFQVAPGQTPLEVKPVSIGARCWIGERVCILPGVTVGDDCIIGAGSVVTRNIPAKSIAVGVPARPIKQRDANGRWQPLQHR